MNVYVCIIFLDYRDYNSIIVIKIIHSFYYRDNSNFPDTTVHYIKHADALVYRRTYGDISFSSPSMYTNLVSIYVRTHVLSTWYAYTVLQ